MKSSYLDYAMSVIVSRALPDVRDGLKPVHQRIIYAMKEGDMITTVPSIGPYCRRCYGQVSPPWRFSDLRCHGANGARFLDAAAADSGQGNFGSMDGDRAAAMRYTEARLAHPPTP